MDSFMKVWVTPWVNSSIMSGLLLNITVNFEVQNCEVKLLLQIFIV